MLRLVALLTVAGCSFAGEPEIERDTSASIQTDRVTYTALASGPAGGVSSYSFDLVARFTNTTPDTVYLRRHRNGLRPAFSIDGTAYSVLDFGADGVSLAVGPGRSRTDTLAVFGPHLIGSAGSYDGRLAGRMRLTYEAARCEDLRACPLPDSVAVSNEFEVRLE
ncbi:hypothetical protein [Rubrivirga sp. IMCC45206]|uniref:hypothetical protein n=1 Tax=Rubrivirga sp. IMCC45206 TaxID=3391614 RepID=UPI00398F9712